MRISARRQKIVQKRDARMMPLDVCFSHKEIEAMPIGDGDRQPW